MCSQEHWLVSLRFRYSFFQTIAVDSKSVFSLSGCTAHGQNISCSKTAFERNVPEKNAFCTQLLTSDVGDVVAQWLVLRT